MPHSARKQFDYPNQILAANDNYVVGTTTLNGAMLAALDSEGNDSGNLHLKTSQLIVKDIQDSATSKNVSVGISADINSPTKKDESNKGNTPTLDASYSSSDFKQTTKGTIGNGTIEVANAESSTPLSAINRDIKNTQTVTKNAKSGFSLYYDKGAIDETIKLLSNDDSSIILAVAKDPKKAIEDLYGASAKEITILFNLNKNKKVTSLDDIVDFNDKSQVLELFKILNLKFGIETAKEQIDKETAENNVKIQGALDYIDGRINNIDAQIETAKANGDNATADELEKQVNNLYSVKGVLKDQAQTNPILNAAIRINPNNPESVLVGQLYSSGYKDGGVDNTDPEFVIVYGNRINKNQTVGEMVVNTMVKAKDVYDSIDPTTKTLFDASIRILQGGPLRYVLDSGISKGIELAVKAAPRELVEAVSKKVNELKTMVGDGGVSVLTDRKYDDVSKDSSTETRVESSATYWGASTIIGAASITTGLTKALKNEAKVANELEVDSYKNLKSKGVVGDNLEHDHIPSFASLKAAEEAKLKRSLTPDEEKLLYNNATAITVDKSIHAQSRTYKGKNTAKQVEEDAANLCGAMCKDTEALRKNMINSGYDPKLINTAIKKIVKRNKDMGIK